MSDPRRGGDSRADAGVEDGAHDADHNYADRNGAGHGDAGHGDADRPERGTGRGAAAGLAGLAALAALAQLAHDAWARLVRAWVAAQERRRRTRGRRGRPWRWAVPLAFALTGALLVTSAVSSGGTDLRAGRYGDLDGLVRQQSREVDALQERAANLTDEVNSLSAKVGDRSTDRLQSRIAELRGPAGLKPVTGPGLTVTLSDAPDAVIDTADRPVNDLIVHQQDIQAVVNALWNGGAEAMTLQGQRVVSTTGIKCVGNTVRLHGVPYAPPYEISAIGDGASMLESLNTSRYIEIYKQYADRYRLGYDVAAEPGLELPGYQGPLDLNYARAAGQSAPGTPDDDL